MYGRALHLLRDQLPRLGLEPGVQAGAAANLVGPTYLAAGQSSSRDSRDLLRRG